MTPGLSAITSHKKSPSYSVKMQTVNIPHPNSICEGKTSVDRKKQCSLTKHIFYHKLIGP